MSKSKWVIYSIGVVVLLVVSTIWGIVFFAHWSTSKIYDDPVRVHKIQK